jgi:hypothetical protein
MPNNFCFVIFSLEKGAWSHCSWAYGIFKSQDSSVGIAKGSTAKVGFPEREKVFLLLYGVQIDFGSHPVSYPMGNEDYFPGVKATKA